MKFLSISILIITLLLGFAINHNTSAIRANTASINLTTSTIMLQNMRITSLERNHK